MFGCDGAGEGGVGEVVYGDVSYFLFLIYTRSNFYGDGGIDILMMV